MSISRGAFLASLTGAGSAILEEKTFVNRARAGRAAHRQAFAVARVGKGAALFAIVNSLNAYEFAWREGPQAIDVVAVLYGTACALALNDDAWNTYRLAAVLESERDPIGIDREIAGNAFYSGFDELRSVAALQRRGVTFYVCNNALGTLAAAVARHGQGEAHEVYEEFTRRLAPDILVVPAGVAALNSLQEQKYTFFLA